MTKKAQEKFDTEIDLLMKAKWALSPADLGSKCQELTQACIAVLKSSDHKGGEMDSALEKLRDFTELRALKYTEFNAKKLAEEEKEVNEILKRVIAKMKEEVDAEVSERVFKVLSLQLRYICISNFVCSCPCVCVLIECVVKSLHTDRC
jgi:hypothetical protein